MPPTVDSPGTLWIVATPIGTLGDMAPRAKEVLGAVDLILAEDTRRARQLLSHCDLPAAGRLQSLHEHNEHKKIETIVSKLHGGSSVALISDAGTPVISDPGFLLVRAVRRGGLPVCSAPGPSSFTAALAASGQPPLPAILCGFLPARSGQRRRRIDELAACPWTMVVLLSPHRLGREIEDLADRLGEDRDATLMAELSKRFERATLATLGELVACPEVERPRGEYILVIGPPVESRVSDQCSDPPTVRKIYSEALALGLERPAALRETARRLGVRRRAVFDALRVADEDEPDGSET